MKLQQIQLILLLLITISCSSKRLDNSLNKILKQSDFMLKLYKNINGELHYWETWNSDDKTAIIHWGKVGQKGKDKEVKNELSSTFREIVQKELDERIKEGYSEFDEDKLSFLEIEYEIDGFGSEEDLDKRHRLENRMNETLGWTGLGHTDGGSTGSGTMEVGCIVVDFEIAKKVIMKDLTNTEFENYTRIFEMK